MDLPEETFIADPQSGALASLRHIHTLAAYLLAIHAGGGAGEDALWRAVRPAELRSAEEALADVCLRVTGDAALGQ